jgi:hypothetical protein
MNGNKADAGLGIPFTANPTFNRHVFIDGYLAFQKAINCNGAHLHYGLIFFVKIMMLMIPIPGTARERWLLIL